MQLIYPTSGHAEILDRPVGDVSVKRRIGYLPESPYFYDYLTAEELLDYYAALFGYDRVERRRRVSALLDQVGIAGERRLPLRKFSKGMIQRVGIAQALINDPEVVFFDEPMSGLDPLGRREVRNLILSLRDRGCTVFFSSHVLSDAEALCNRVAVLAHGKLVANGRISDLQAFDIRGWELIVSGLTPESLERHRARVQRVTPIGEQRYSLELPLEPAARATAPRAYGQWSSSGVPQPHSRNTGRLLREKDRRAGERALERDRRTPQTVMTTGVVRTIAVSVFRESVRDKVLYNLVFFAVLLIAVSYLLSQLTAGQDMKVIKDLGLAAMSLFGLFIAVFIGIGLVSKEVEKRSIYSLLAKPIRRQEFVVGKYLGLLLTLFVNLAIMAIAYYAVLGAVAWVDGAWFRPHWEAPAVDPALLKAIAMIFLQLAIVVAIALFFSTFSSPMLAAALTCGLYVVGHFNADLKNFETVVDSKPVAYIALALYYLLPNLAPLDIKSEVVHAVPVPATYLLLNTAYAVVYISVLVSAATFIFARRDFK